MFPAEFALSDVLAGLLLIAAVVGICAAVYAMYVVKKDDSQDDDE